MTTLIRNKKSPGRAFGSTGVSSLGAVSGAWASAGVVDVGKGSGVGLLVVTGLGVFRARARDWVWRVTIGLVDELDRGRVCTNDVVEERRHVVGERTPFQFGVGVVSGRLCVTNDVASGLRESDVQLTRIDGVAYERDERRGAAPG